MYIEGFTEEGLIGDKNSSNNGADNRIIFSGTPGEMAALGFSETTI